MSNIRLVGLTSIRIGDVGAGGAMSTTLQTIAYIVPDSAHLIIEAPGMTDLYIEESDVPDIQILGTSKKTIEFATRDMGGNVLVEAFGGATSATGAVWSAAVTAAVIKERCIEAVSKDINDKFSSRFSRIAIEPGAASMNVVML